MWNLMIETLLVRRFSENCSVIDYAYDLALVVNANSRTKKTPAQCLDIVRD